MADMIIAAPMAGGPSTPALVRAIALEGEHKGCFGFLASGNITAAQLACDIAEVGDVVFGINFFMPQHFVPSAAQLAQAAEAVLPIVSQCALAGQQVAVSSDFAFQPADLSNQFEEKFAVAVDSQATVLSASFGCFDKEHLDRIHEQGKQAWVNVTCVSEALAAMRHSEGSIDALIVQGHEAGGHRLSWEVEQCPNNTPTAQLLVEVAEALADAGFAGTKLVAAGGVRNGRGIRALIDAGASAVMCGSAFLLADESGTNPANRQLLREHRSAGLSSVSSRGFSGRVARGLATPVTELANHGMDHVSKDEDDFAPVYPYLSQLTKLIPGGYCLSGDPEGISAGPAGSIVASLIDESGI